MAGCKFRRQDPIAGFFADFACPQAKLIVELDGGQHFEQEAMHRDHPHPNPLSKAGEGDETQGASR
jgi:very-short-patch-repair endonuclease